jgi:hypothetical protein
MWNAFMSPGRGGIEMFRSGGEANSNTHAIHRDDSEAL